MVNNQLNNPLLRRFWFKVKGCHGFGVTAYTLDNAKHLLDQALDDSKIDYQRVDIIEDIDVRDLGQGHVIPNMGAPNLRGVWFLSALPAK